MSKIQDFSLFAGDDKPVDGTTEVDLTGATVRFFIRNSINSTAELIVKDSNSGGITITNVVEGKYTFTLSKAETTTMRGAYYYEVEVIDALGNVTTFTTGTITVEVGRVSYSYATVDYADAYFDEVLFPEPWPTTDADTKAKALRMATKKIDSLVLIGRRAVSDQPQEFPRALYNSGLQVWVSETEVAQCVRDATCEEALALLKGGQQAGQRAELQRQGVKSFTLGKLTETYKDDVAQAGVMSSPTARNLLLRYTGGSRAIG